MKKRNWLEKRFECSGNRRRQHSHVETSCHICLQNCYLQKCKQPGLQAPCHDGEQDVKLNRPCHSASRHVCPGSPHLCSLVCLHSGAAIGALTIKSPRIFFTEICEPLWSETNIDTEPSVLYQGHVVHAFNDVELCWLTIFLENESFGDSPLGKFPCPCLPACPRNKKTNWHSRVLCKQKYIITKSHVHGMPSFKSIPCCSTLSLHCRMAFWSAAQKNRGPETQFLDLKSYNTLCCSQPSIVFLNPTCNHTHHPSQHNVSRRAPCDGHKSPRFAPWNMLAKIVNSGSEAIKTHGLLLLPQFFPFHDPSNCQPFVPGCGDQRVEHHWVGWDQCCSAHHDNACRDFVMTMAFCGGHIRPSMERTCRYCLWAWCLREQVGSVLLLPQESKYIWRYCGSDRVSTGAGRWRHGSLALLR